MTIYWLIIPIVTILTFVLTGYVRHYAITNQIMDIPNNRSSHIKPTPRGGGVALVGIYLATLPLLHTLNILTFQVVLGMLIAGLSVAMVGFVDDRRGLAARWRLLIHFLAATWGVANLGGMHSINVLGFNIAASWYFQLVAIVYLVWLLNLYNFMDGIDGIAGIEAISVLFAGGILLVFLKSPETALVPLLLGAAVAGFLFWNFPPAKIFMGDVGSGFLGLMLGLISLYTAQLHPDLLWSWIILLGVFVVDATFTLLRRLFRGINIAEPHRSHAYQRAARLYGSHKKVTLAIGLINLIWLSPWAVAAGLGYIDGAVAVFFAYVPLIFIVWKLKAGTEE